MDDETLRSRLSQISTRWTLLRDVHSDDLPEAQQAHAALFERYRAAAWRYLVAVLRSPDAADEVFQDFAVRLLKGDFQAATPEKGRFRSYLKTILSRMAVDHFRKRKRQGVELTHAAEQIAGVENNVAGEAFEECWRTELLERAWAALAEYEAQTESPYHTVLLFQSRHPEIRSKELASRMTEQLQPERPFTDAGIRQIIHRARSRFAQLLIDEVVTSIGSEDEEDIEDELAALQLLRYCESVLSERRK